MNGNHIAIPTVLKIGKGALDNLGEYIRAGGMKKAVIYFGNGLVEMFGIRVMESLKESGIEVLEYRELDSVRIEDIVELAFAIDAKAQIIVGLGGGKVIDAAKYAAAAAAPELANAGAQLHTVAMGNDRLFDALVRGTYDAILTDSAAALYYMR